MASAPQLTHYEDDLLRQQNARWQLLSLIAGAGCVLALVVIAILLHQPRMRPYVVMVDPKGEPVALARTLAGGPMSMQEAAKRYLIQEFIRHAKTVTDDLPEEKEHLNDAYALAGKQGRAELDAYYHDPRVDRIPFDIAKKSWVQVSIPRVLKSSVPDTYQVDWEESRSDYNTVVTEYSSWRATITVGDGPVTDRNPLGLYVTNLDWAEDDSQQQ
jgi:type IV secretory pathway TrbF-like protein